NVRERRAEIGILRALGLRSRQILLVFLGKAIMIGLVGAVAGYLAGWIGGALWAGGPEGAVSLAALFDPRALVLALVAAPVLSGLAGWLPAVAAAQADPAEVLREE
ncbi:MAG: FtsX-like permease family protein, partial [Planctomycetota bacterium]